LWAEHCAANHEEALLLTKDNVDFIIPYISARGFDAPHVAFWVISCKVALKGACRAGRSHTPFAALHWRVAHYLGGLEFSGARPFRVLKRSGF